ncbi:MAG: hypothetical protein ACE5EE_07205 [Fidelibacterota bacterium]
MYNINRVSAALFVVLWGGTGLFGASLPSDDTDEVRPVDIESFTSVPKIESIILSWTMNGVPEEGQFNILRSESFGGQYESVTTVTSDIRLWIDRNVDTGRYYYYRLSYVDENGNIIDKSDYLPQFASPLELPDNIERVAHSPSFSDTEEVLLSTFFVQPESSASNSFTEDSGLIQPSSSYELFCRMVLDPILFGSDMETRNSLIWLDAGSQSGLVIRENFELQIRDVHRLQVYDNFTSRIEEDDESRELPLALQLDIVNRLEELADSEYPQELIDEFGKHFEIFNDSPTGMLFPDEQWIAPDPSSFVDLLGQWREQLAHVRQYFGEDEYPVVSEVWQSDTGEVSWIEFLAMGDESFPANEYSVQVNGEVLFELPEILWEPSKVYVIPISQIDDNLQIEEILVMNSEGEEVDDFICPSQLPEGSIGRDLRGEIWLYDEPSPNRLNMDRLIPVMINEYAVSRETEETDFLMDAVNHSLFTLEIMSVESEIPDLSTRLRIKYDTEGFEPVELTGWNLFNEFSIFTVDFPVTEDHLLLTLQMSDVEEGWVDLEYLILKPSELVHKARVPDGTKWTDSAQVTFGESNGRSRIESRVLGLPEVFALYQNFPNPFNVTTTIKFDLLESAIITLVVIDAAGREVAEFLREMPMEPGKYDYTLSAEGMSSGIYFVTLKAVVEDNIPMVDSRKMIFLK